MYERAQRTFLSLERGNERGVTQLNSEVRRGWDRAVGDKLNAIRSVSREIWIADGN